MLALIRMLHPDSVPNILTAEDVLGYWVFGIGCRILGIWYWVLDIGYLGIRYWVFGTGYWVLGIGY